MVLIFGICREISEIITCSSNFDSSFSLLGTNSNAVPITSGLIFTSLEPIFMVIGAAIANSAKLDLTLLTSSLLTLGGI